MSTATWIRDELEQHHVAFDERHHREAYTAQAVAQQEHISGHHVAKVVIVIADGRPVELVLPASRRVLLDWVKDILHAKSVRLATEEEMEQRFPDCERGAIPPLRHWDGVEVIMDASLQTAGTILFQAGTHCDAVRIQFDDWFRLVNPRVESFSVLASEMAEAEAEDFWQPGGDF
jgi:Ala-tRNA(Pro) deacylase